jgi:DNA (cytosine-5)-methyltransferase 1
MEFVMQYLSLFSGVEAATVAWRPLGWECVAVAEIEPFPCAVLQHHYPNTPNLGDISKITKEQIINLGHIDIVVGGFPCQDVSVAGLRKGLEDAKGNRTRSGLFYDAMRIVRWCKEYCGTRFLLIENVPGLLSSKLGADFASVLGEMVGTAITPPKDKWKNSGVVIGPDGMCEWGILDAQYFGVPQRRRRVFALADFGDWADRPPILLEPESLCGNPPPSRETGEEITRSTGKGAARGRGFSRVGEIRGQDPVVACLIGMGEYAESEIGSPVRRSQGDCGGGSETLLCVATRQAGAEKAENLSTSLTCNHEAPIICYAVRTANTDANGHGIAEEVTHTLDQANGQAVAACLRSGGDGGVPSSMGENLIVVHGTQDPCVSETTAFALGLNNGGENVVAFQQNASGDVFSGAISGTVATNANASGRNCQMVLRNSAVRRLTTTECERLQGFPDDYTNIPWRGKPTAPDGPRYKAIGNSMAVPVMRWVGERINFIDFLYGE